MAASRSPAPKIALYGRRQVPYTEKCRRALLLKRLEFELHEPSSPEDVQRWSPETGLLPVMTVDGELVSDSTNILLRLDEIRGEPPLVSRDPTVAAQQRQLENWADESFLFYYQEWQRVVVEPEQPEPASRPRGRLRRWLRSPKARALPEAELLQGLEARLTDLVNLLGTRRFFYADRISMADLTIYGMLSSLGRDAIPGAAALIQSRSALLEFMRRVEAETGG